MDQLIVVEDSDEDFTAITRALRGRTSARVLRYADGDQILADLGRVSGSEVSPHKARSVILLDLNLPGTDGREVLRLIKAHPIWRSIPVVVFTTSDNPRDVSYCYDQGANGYMVKAIDYLQFEARLRSFSHYWEHTMRLLPSPLLSTKVPH